MNISIAKMLRTSILLILSVLVIACGGNSDSTASKLGVDNTVSKVELLPLGDVDIGSANVDSTLDALALPSVNVSKDRVTFSQVLENNKEILVHQDGYRKQSRSFKMTVSAESLSKGIQVPVSSDTPIIRVIPIGGAGVIEKQNIQIEKGGIWVSGEDAFEVVADQNELNAAGFKASQDTLAMKLKSTSNNGPLTLKIEGISKTQGEYQVHVLEAKSNKVLSLRLLRNKLLKGESLEINIELSKGNSPLGLDKVDGYLLSPQGLQKRNVKLTIDGGRVEAQLDTSTMQASVPGLWEFHVAAEHGGGGQRVLRNAKVAFALSPKTGRLLGEASYSKPQSDRENLTITFDVESAVAGRYEVSAVIYGINSDGNLQAGVMASTAQWLDANDAVTLEIPSDQLLEADISAPFEVRHLSLKDQTRMAELWLQEKALVVNY